MAEINTDTIECSNCHKMLSMLTVEFKNGEACPPLCSQCEELQEPNGNAKALVLSAEYFESLLPEKMRS